jgi:hypothetical protein
MPRQFRDAHQRSATIEAAGVVIINSDELRVKLKSLRRHGATRKGISLRGFRQPAD